MKGVNMYKDFKEVERAVANEFDGYLAIVYRDYVKMASTKYPVEAPVCVLLDPDYGDQTALVVELVGVCKFKELKGLVEVRTIGLGIYNVEAKTVYPINKTALDLWNALNA